MNWLSILGSQIKFSPILLLLEQWLKNEERYNLLNFRMLFYYHFIFAAQRRKGQSFNALGSFATRFWKARNDSGLLRVGQRTQRTSAVPALSNYESICKNQRNLNKLLELYLRQTCCAIEMQTERYLASSSGFFFARSCKFSIGFDWNLRIYL